MVILNRIYTRAGDGGDTALGDGSRRDKDDLRVAAYGCVDETNACIGVARLHAGADADADDIDLDAMLGRIQNDLFDLGADLCRPPAPDEGERGGEGAGADADRSPLRVSDAQVARLEREIDALNEGLQPLRSFVLPGGSAAAAYLHLARTAARRAERCMVSLSRREPVGAPALRYANRLSDFLFVAARFANAGGAGDVLWQPGENL